MRERERFRRVTLKCANKKVAKLYYRLAFDV